MSPYSGDRGNIYINQPGNYGEQYERNVTLLSETELGLSLLPAYQAAVEYDTRLAGVEIVPIGDEVPAHVVAHAVPSWDTKRNQSGRHQVHLRLNGTGYTSEAFQQDMQLLPVSRRIFCERAGIDPAALTPALYMRFALLHELGHIPDLERLGQEQFTDQRLAEILSLPCPGKSPSKLVHSETSTRIWMQGQTQRLASLGISTYEQLVERQQEAYRNLGTEREADLFMQNVLEANPELRLA